MGWTQTLRHSGLTSQQIATVVQALNLTSILGGPAKQDWGWSTHCDITLGEEAITFSGSWIISGETDVPQRFLAEARRLGLPVSRRLGPRE